jgi:hypothetical protein
MSLGSFFTDFPHYKKKFKGFAHVKFHDLPDNPRLKAHAFTVISSIGSLVDSIDDPEVLSELLISIGHNHKPRKLTMKDFQVKTHHIHACTTVILSS